MHLKEQQQQMLSKTDNFTADKVNDGNDTTRWASEVRSATNENPHWLQIELPKLKQSKVLLLIGREIM